MLQFLCSGVLFIVSITSSVKVSVITIVSYMCFVPPPPHLTYHNSTEIHLLIVY